MFKYRLEGSTRFVMEEQAYNDNRVMGDLFGEVPTSEVFGSMLAVYEAKDKR